ncbi:MAG TPA: protein kinase [Bryobacteraceae bacterium]
MSVTEISPDWQTLQGTTLEGGYELKDIVEAAGERAVLRVRVLGDYTLKAVAIFHVLDRDAADEQVAIWQSIRGFEKTTSVSVPLGTGKLLLNGTPIVYVVYRAPDETLREGIEGRALTSEEATDAVRAMAKGLAELHGNGYVHGYLAPEEVRALSERVEISTEAIRRVNAEPIAQTSEAKYRAPESAAHNVTIAADIWCLGATIFEALTRKTYEAGLREEAAALKHPLGTLLDGCLDPDPEKRTKLVDFEPILRSKAPPPRPQPVAVPAPEPVKAEPVKAEPAAPVNGAGTNAVAPAEKAASEVAPAPAAKAENTDAPAHRPVLPKELPPKTASAESRKLPNELPARAAAFDSQKLPNERLPNERRARRSEEAEAGGNFSAKRGWLYAIGAFAVIFLILWLIRSHARQTPAAGPVPAAEAPAAKQPAWETKTLTPENKGAAAPARTTPPVSKPEPPVTAGGARTIWRVVLYTYRREQDAQNKAHELTSKRPDLQTEVFTPGAAGGPFLVVAGGRMTRDEAARMRLKAIQEGMPHDSYIQNYSK